jgi:hypothetical protein
MIIISSLKWGLDTTSLLDPPMVVPVLSTVFLKKHKQILVIRHDNV